MGLETGRPTPGWSRPARRARRRGGVSTSDGTVTFDALQKGGVTVTATAAPAAASAGVPQTVANIAQVAYDVTVSLIDLVITLSGPDDLNLTEGGWATLTATANRPVAARTVFDLHPDRRHREPHRLRDH